MKTTYLKNKILEHITGKTTYTKPTNTYIGLLTSDPTVAGLQTSELFGGAYARVQATWGTASSGLIATTADVFFNDLPTATLKYWAVFDAATNGNMLEYFPFELPIETVTPYDFTVLAGNLKLRDA